MDRRLAIVASLALLLPTLAAAARQGTLRFGAGYVEPTGESTGAGTSRYSLGVLQIFNVETSYRLEASAAATAFVAFELPLRDRLGLEISVERQAGDLTISAIHDIVTTHNDTGEELGRFRNTTGYSGDFTAYPVTVGLDFHPLGQSGPDVYLGPVLAWVFAGDADFDTPIGPQSVPMDDDFGYGAVVGVDLPLRRSRWVFAASLRYLQAEVQPERVPTVFPSKFFLLDDPAPAALELDPLVLRIGVGRRFGGS